MKNSLHEILAKALSICIPETDEEMQMECVECPLYETCDTHDYVHVPIELILLLKDYFNNNWSDSNKLQ